VKEKHCWEFYPQDGGESQLASKLRRSIHEVLRRHINLWSRHDRHVVRKLDVS